MWVAVADCCLILKLSPIHGCRFKVFTIVACPVSVTPANQINRFRRMHRLRPHGRWTPTGPFILNPFPLQRASWSYSYHPLLGTQYSNHSMHSHSGGPPGTIAIHSWDSHALFSGIVGRFLLFLVISSRGPCRSRLPRTINSFTWTIVHSNRTPRTLVISRGFSSLEWTPTDYAGLIRSSGPCGIRHTAAVSHGPCCPLQLPRTLGSFSSLFAWLVVPLIGLPRTIDPISLLSFVLRSQWLFSHTAIHSHVVPVVSLLIHSSRGPIMPILSTTTDS
jgi:hypothetical protein